MSNTPVVFIKRCCKACEQIERDKKKNADRAKAIIEARAAQRAREKEGGTKKDLLEKFNWEDLIPMMREYLKPGARCPRCRHAFRNERDIQIEHIFPPRGRDDWSREHRTNLMFLCQSCNSAKGNKPPDQWLDESEATRLSNEYDQAERVVRPKLGQPSLFDDSE